MKEQLEQLIRELYIIDCYIPDEKLQAILAYGNDAVPDLRDVLEETIEHFDEYNAKAHRLAQIDEYFEWFLAYHTLFLLAELDATETFPTVWRFYQQDEYFLEFWLYDIWPFYATHALAILGREHEEELKQLAGNSQNNLLSRKIACGTLSKMVRYYPEKKPGILDFYRQILHSEQNSELLTNIVIDILDCYGDTLEQDIYHLYDQGKVNTQILPRDEIVFDVKDAEKLESNIFNIYQKLRTELYHASPHSPKWNKTS